MNWLYYLLESNLYLAVFYGLYCLFLQKETFYTLNRYYLLITTVIAFGLPLLQVGYLYNLIGLHTQISTNQLTVIQTGKQEIISLEDLITVVYVLISVTFLTKLFLNLYKIIALSFRSRKLKEGNILYIELSDKESAFSFFNLLFINPSIAEKNTILKHEMVHINEKHSIDIIFFELIQILSWFNPITYLIKKDVKLLHEFIADEVTTTTDVQKHEYAMFLIHNSFGVAPNQLTNQIFNQSILKRRINMLNQEKSRGRTKLRLLLALPLAGAMLCTSTMAFTKDYALIDLYPEKYSAVDASKQEPTTPPKPPKKTGKKAQVKFPPPIVTPDKPGQAPPPPPVEPPPPRKISKSTKGQVKFPPPIVTPDKPGQAPPPPPPPVEPPPPRKMSKTVKGQVKFPPPIVKKNKSGEAAPKKAVVKFPPPIVKPDKPAEKKAETVTEE